MPDAEIDAEVARRNSKRDILATVAELLLVLEKRFLLLDEELHLLRQLVHYQSSLTHPRYLEAHREHFPLDGVLKARSDPDKDSLATPFPGPRPFLFESLLEVVFLQAQQVDMLLSEVQKQHDKFVSDITSRKWAASGMTPAEHAALGCLIGDLERFSRAFAAVIEAFNHAQLYFIQRCEQTSPSTLGVPRIFKRENEKTISIMENTYRSYRHATLTFVYRVLGRPAQAGGDHDAGVPRERSFDSALSFEHLWSARVSSTHERTIEDFRLFEPRTPRREGSEGALARRYAMVGGASLLLELPRFIPHLAHEVAHLALLPERAGEYLAWRLFAPDVRGCLDGLRDDLGRLFRRETDLFERFERPEEAHLNELLSDFCALYVAGPYYLQSFFYSQASRRLFRPDLDTNVPFAARVGAMLAVSEAQLERAAGGRREPFGPGTDPDARRRRLPGRSLVATPHLSASAGAGAHFAWWRASHTSALATYLEAVRDAKDFSPAKYVFIEGYIQIAARWLRQLAHVVERHLDDLRAPDSAEGLFFRWRRTSEHNDPKGNTLRAVERLTSLGPVAGRLVGRHLVTSPEAPWTCLPRYDWDPSDRVDDDESYAARSAVLHRVIAHLLCYSVAEQVESRGRTIEPFLCDPAEPGDAATAERGARQMRAKPYELRLLHSLHAAKGELLAGILPAGEAVARREPVGPTVQRVFQYRYHWNARNDQSGHPMYFSLKPRNGAQPHAVWRGRHAESDVQKFLGFGEFDIYYLCQKCFGGEEEDLSQNARQYRAPVLIEHSDICDKVEGPEVHYAYARQRDYLDVTEDALGCRPPAILPELHALSQIRFQRAPMNRERFAGAEPADATLRRIVAALGQLPGGQSRARRVLAGYGWEDVVCLWQADSARALVDGVTAFAQGYFDPSRGDAAGTKVDRVVTTLLVPDNHIWRYSKFISDGLRAHPLPGFSGFAAQVAAAIELERRGVRLESFPGTIQGPPVFAYVGGSPVASLAEILSRPVDDRLLAAARAPTCEWVDFRTVGSVWEHTHARGRAVVLELVRAVRGVAAAYGLDRALDLAAWDVTGLTDLVLRWRFPRPLSLSFAFFVITAGVERLARERLLLNCTTSCALAVEDQAPGTAPGRPGG